MSAFDKDTYRYLMESDPIEAQNYLDSFRLGLASPSEVPEALQRWGTYMESIAPQTQTQPSGGMTKAEKDKLAIGFYERHAKTFPMNQEAAAAMDKAIGQFLQGGGNLNEKAMDGIYYSLANSGAIKIDAEKLSTQELETFLSNAGYDVNGHSVSQTKIDTAMYDVTDAELKWAELQTTTDAALEKHLKAKGLI